MNPRTPLDIRRFSGDALHDYLDAVAQLRISVFRDFPYLYQGSMDYERRYLQTYARCPQAVVVIAFDGDRVVGASTGIPLVFEEDNFKRPFVTRGYDPAQVFYCAESVLLPDYRGQGAGVRFFAQREAHARALGGLRWSAFCAVIRPRTHPLRPATYQPLDAFWTRRGYRSQPDMRATYSWKDLDQPAETSKQLSFWLKSLDT